MTLLAGAGLVTLAAVALAIGGWLFFNKDAPKSTTGAFYVVGCAIAAGVFLSFIGRLYQWGITLLGTLTQGLTGVGPVVIGLIVAIVLNLEVVIKGIGIPRPRKATPRRIHPFLALVAPTAALTTGLPLFTALIEGVTQGATSVSGVFG